LLLKLLLTQQLLPRPKHTQEAAIVTVPEVPEKLLLVGPLLAGLFKLLQARLLLMLPTGLLLLMIIDS
jgi:hypothetical protein